MSFIQDVTLEELEHDPFPFYAKMRRDNPVAFVPALNEWLITRWEDCSAVGRLGEDDLIPNQETDRAFFGMPNILCMEGEPHRALRLGIDAKLNPRAVNEYVGNGALDVIRRYIDEFKERGQGDLVAGLFDKISVRAVGDQLGLVDVDDDTLVRWFHTLSAGLTNRMGNSEAALAAQHSIDAIDADLRARIEHWRHNPDNSVISHMLHGGIVDGEPRTFEDVIGSIRVMILGGFQEPGNAVATAFLGLMRNPAQLELAYSNPAEHASAIMHESLRWVAPISMVTRQTRRAISVGEVVIPANNHITLVVGSANRDERVFENGESFDFRRPRKAIATFGYGSHHCSGHFLAKGLGEAIIREVLLNFPKLKLAVNDEPIVRGMLFRGTKYLPSTWG